MRHALLLVLPLLWSCGPKAADSTAAAAQASAWDYPDAARGDVVDTYHGVQVADPYRWLEDPDSDASRAWIEAENALTRSYIDAVPQRQAIQDRLHALWNHERFGTPFHQGGRYFWTRNDGLQNQNVLYVADGLDAEPRPLLDPNGWSEDGTVALGSYAVTEDARYIAYSKQDGGSDWRIWHIRDIDSGADLADELRWVKFSGVSWLPDGSGFFYSRYPEPDKALQDVTENNSLYFHRRGTPQAEDLLVYAEPDHPQRGFGAGVTDDGEHAVITVWEGTENKCRVYVMDLDEGWQDALSPEGPRAEVTRIFDAYDAAWYQVADEGDRLWFWTNKDAPKGRVVSLTLAAPGELTEVVPESEHVLETVNRVGGHLVLQRLEDAKSAVEVVTLDGAHVRDVALPGVGSVGGFAGDPDRDETFYGFTGFTSPHTIYRYDVATGEQELLRRPALAFDPDGYVTEQRFATSRDGTRVPYFVTHKKGLAMDGSNPTILYGYGGFNISLTPWFSVSNVAWLELGGVYVVANLRGGGEYGEAWHEAGTKLQKQNVFDDLFAVAEQLQADGLTRPDKLAVMGGSNGGLLVGAAITQRPELFGAALPAVGVLDMLRYHQFTIGWAWASDYGTSADPDEFKALLAYSPVHNTKPGTAYPATLITTADHDDRVVPAHSFKFAAALQHAQGGPAPVLIRVETRAGHGGGKPTTMVIEELADRYAFLFRALDMQPQIPQASGASPAESE
ncbi:MAG: S9 family peptidase [Alphaproteobacteria bacterium]|nr:S9 family peptidase [Alphaproteobacteria bacterium]